MNKRFLSAASLIALLLSLQVGVSAQDTPDPYGTNVNINYIRVWDAVKPDSNTADITTAAEPAAFKMTTQYFDGLGRPLQTVIKKGSLITDSTNPASPANAVDMVSANVYDEFGREQFKYLPSPANNTGSNTSITDGMFKLNPFQQQAAFYNNTYFNNPIKGQGETYFYSQTNYEPSPLNRVQETFAPGNSWVGTSGNATEDARKSVKAKYYINTLADTVRIWTVTNGTLGTFGTYASSGIYPAGELYKNITVDENQKQVIEFKDKEGKVILKKVQLTATADDGTGRGHTGWLCTYYIYDDLGNLRCVIQPRGVELISPSWALNDATILAEQCFRYEYDQRNRMIMKKVPGAGIVNMVYDARDRLVMTQDANMLAQGKYLVTKYDDLNRLVETGLWTNSTSAETHRENASVTNNPPLPYPSITGTYEMLSQTFYDNYNWVSGSGSPITNTGYESTYNTYLNASSNSAWPYPQANTQSQQVTGMATGTKIKILGSTSSYLYTINIYDNKGRAIQVKSNNISGGTDMATIQYSWAGQPLITVQKQEKVGTPTQTSVVVTQYTHDDLGRLTKTEKKLSNSLVNGNAMSAYNTISTIEYDALGQLSKKIVAPQYNSGLGLETLKYDYNIRGWLLGENRDYAKSASSTTNHFGFDLGYDKTTITPTVGSSIGSYAAPELNGNIEGMVWKSAGDGEIRKYDFNYDNANRLMKADFNQYTSGTFNKTANVDFSVKMGDGSSATSAYDANGNILRMQQWGLKIGGSSQIDDLTYNYQYLNNSNKLLNVGDAFNDNQTKLGDFRVSALNPVQTKTTTTVDYSYDDNGNMVKDLNKDLVTYGGGNGIQYNYLNLPTIITLKKDANSNKGTITYTYDAAGNKLMKVVLENASVGNNNITTTTTTTYINGLVYESKTDNNSQTVDYTDKLQYIPDEEGRIRSTTNASQLWAFDYFIKDHLGNVRMVLTDEQKINFYPAATLEGTYDASSNSMVNFEKGFYRIDNTKITLETSIPSWGTETIANTKLYYNNNGNPPANLSYPSGCSPVQTTGSTKLYKLNATTNKTGLEFMIKVMAGDHVDIFGKSYYLNTTNITNGNSTALDLLSLMSQVLLSPSSAAAAKGITAAQLNTINSGVFPSSFFRGNNSEATTTIPKAYINYIFLDDNFKYAGGGASRVGGSGTVKDHWQQDAQLQNITVPKNGYIFVYVSNESNLDVFFDNLQVIHKPGPILEETHYYPFGLTMAGISDKAFGGVENRYKYNDIELDTSLGLNEYTAQLRDLDPQTGRWWQVDPETEDQEMWSPYTSNYDNPILYKDPRGNEGEACCGGVVQLGEDAVEIYRALRGGENILDQAKNNSITWKSVINGIGNAIQFDQGGVIEDPLNLKKEQVVTPKPAELILPPDTKVKGVIYEVPGAHTKTGKPYVGRTKHSDPAKRRSDGGRDRKKAKVVDTYDPNNTQSGREKEQQKIDEKGLENLDNKRNEIKLPKPDPPKPNDQNKTNPS